MNRRNIPVKKIVIIASIVAVIGIIVAIIVGKVPQKLVHYLYPESSISLNKTANPLSSPEGRKYFDDVIYTGPVKYPELYDYAFQKTDFYIKNKETVVDKDKVCQIAEDFIKSLYGGGYRSVADNAQEYADNLEYFFDSDAMIFSDIDPVITENTMAGDFVQQAADLIVENRINAEMKLVTNASLVYEDAYVWVRGMVEKTVFNSDNESDKSDPELIMVDIALKPVQDEHYYQICGILKVDTESEEADMEKPEN